MTLSPTRQAAVDLIREGRVELESFPMFEPRWLVDGEKASPLQARALWWVSSELCLSFGKNTSPHRFGERKVASIRDEEEALR